MKKVSRQRLSYKSQPMSFGSNNKRLQDADAMGVRIAAMDMLARRDHSRTELINKLCDKGAELSLAEAEVAKLVAENLQSDERFVEALVNSTVRKGRGPMRLRMDFAKHRLDDSLLEQALETVSVDWYALAEEVYKKKYGDSAVDDYNERAKRMRFLQSRGFTSQHIHGALP